MNHKEILDGKSIQLKAFLSVYMQCLSLHHIDDAFLIYVTDLFNDLSPQEKLEHQDIFKHVQAKAQHKSSHASKQLKEKFRVPNQIFHSRLTTIETSADRIIESNLIEPLKFPSLNQPKRIFLLYGFDNNGKTAVINHTYKSLERIKPSLSHFRDDGHIWNTQNFQNRQEQLNLLIAFLTNITIANPEAWILFEMQHFDEIANDDMKSFLESIVKLDKVVFIATTNKPQLCHNVISLYCADIYLPIFIDLPDVDLIGEILQQNIFRFIKSSDINNSNSEFLGIANEFTSLLMHEIAPQLVCRPSKYIYKKSAELRKCCLEAKTQYGITTGQLNMYLIPVFLKCLSNARKNWYNSEQQCFYKLPSGSGTTSSSSKKLNKELIYKETDLTKEESLQLHKGKINNEVLKDPVMCQDSSSLYVDWKWLREAKETVFDIARECLTAVKDNEEENRLYEELVRFYDSH